MKKRRRRRWKQKKRQREKQELGALAVLIALGVSSVFAGTTDTFTNWVNGTTVAWSVGAGVALLAVIGIGLKVTRWAKRYAREAAEQKRFEWIQYVRDTDQFDGHSFEEFVAYLLRKHGYTINSRPYKGADNGIDITFENDGALIAVQVKRHKTSNTIGAPTVNQFVGAYTYHQETFAGGWFITNSTFTPRAHEYARSVPHLRLIDRIELGEMMANVLADGWQTDFHTSRV